MSWVLHTMTRNASGLEFPGGLSLLLLYTLREQQLWHPVEGMNSSVLGSFCSPQLCLQETCPSSSVQTSLYFFFNSSCCQTKDFQLRGSS